MQRYSFGGKFLEGGVWGGGLCVFFAVFSLSLPLSFPLPQKKRVFFSFFFSCVVFFPTTKSVWKTRLVLRGPFYNQKKK